jgi:carotenoid cleavage dioxygenase
MRFKPVESFYGTQRAFRFEADVFDCEVEGEIPPALNGTLYRVGPDTQYPTRDGDIIINGDGMISAFHFADGHVDFRCRYVKTERLLTERQHRRRLYGKYRNPHTDDPATAGTDRDATGNTSAFMHNGKLFALREDSLPRAIDPVTLETLEVHDFDGQFAGLTMSAHPKLDPQTGEWWSFGLFAHKRYDGDMMLILGDRDGKLVRQEPFQAPYPGVVHDFAVTRGHVVFPVMPLVVDRERVANGGDFYAYDAALPSMWGIMPRGGSVDDLRWIAVPNAFSGHIMNAYDGDDGTLHVDATISRGNSFRFFAGSDGQPTNPHQGIATLTRLSFDLSRAEGGVTMTPFPGAVGEMPRCDERYAMERYRWGFAKSPTGIIRLDWDTMARDEFALAPAEAAAQEPVFVPRGPGAVEGDGYVLSLVNRHQENRADLVVLDTRSFTGPPVAVVRLPFNQPLAFHGTFVAAS